MKRDSKLMSLFIHLTAFDTDVDWRKQGGTLEARLQIDSFLGTLFQSGQDFRNPTVRLLHLFHEFVMSVIIAVKKHHLSSSENKA